MKKNLFDPNKSFIELPIAIWTTAIFLAIAALITATIVANSDLNFAPTHEGFNYAANAFKFPLGILATLIPIIALLAANHKSEQTKEQMRLASTNNNFTNYFKHLSEFESYIEKHQEDKSIIIKSIRNLHKLSFPYAKLGNYQASNSLIKKSEETIEKIIHGIEELKNQRELFDKTSKSLESSKSSLFGKEKEILDRIRQLNTNLSEEKNKKSIKDLQAPQSKSKKIDSIEKEIETENNELEKVRKILEEKNNAISIELKPLTEKLLKASAECQRIAKEIIDTIKIKKEATTTTKQGEIEKREEELINKYHTDERPLILAIAKTLQTIDTSLKFDENYQTSKNIEIFINNFNSLENRDFNEAYNKFTEEFKAIKID
ncbi:hypothetical protein HNQ27_22420 [Pseudomonas sp. B11D7D]|nr:hypothetical protein [Pseudomonas sp. B11D7D]QNH05393.1 hypothetical protein HNQ27_22420 [Pseudomonas sp. B11D7D]